MVLLTWSQMRMMISQIPPRLDRLIKEYGRATQGTDTAFSSSPIATRLQLEADMELAYSQEPVESQAEKDLDKREESEWLKGVTPATIRARVLRITKSHATSPLPTCALEDVLHVTCQFSPRRVLKQHSLGRTWRRFCASLVPQSQIQGAPFLCQLHGLVLRSAD